MASIIPEEEIIDALDSGDTDKVDAILDRLSSVDIESQAKHYETCISGLVDLYDRTNDGYVRQSVIRAVQALMPGMVAAYKAVDESVQSEMTVEGVTDRLEVGCQFLLRGIQDGDGRVRQSARRALKDAFRAYDTLEDCEALVAIRDELETLADEVDSDRRKHVQEAISDADVFLQSDEARVLGALTRLGDRARR